MIILSLFFQSNDFILLAPQIYIKHININLGYKVKYLGYSFLFFNLNPKYIILMSP
jgi:hypothetical protein